MSINNIQSDYTPKDFLQKLLGKKNRTEPKLEETLNTDSNKFSSQSTIEDINHSQQNFSPKNGSVKRIHFQSVQNIQSPVKSVRQPLIHEKNSNQFKENSIKKLNPRELKGNQISQNKSQDQQFKSHCDKVSFSHGKSEQCQQRVDSESVVLQKTKLFMKTALSGKLDNQLIEQLISKLQRGCQNTFQFDKIISGFNQVQRNTNEQTLTRNEHNRSQSEILQRPKSKSIDFIESSLRESMRRSKSQLKLKYVPNTKMQLKRASGQTRKQILKSIKQMKQLIFLNEKSLKRTRNISMY